MHMPMWDTDGLPPAWMPARTPSSRLRRYGPHWKVISVAFAIPSFIVILLDLRKMDTPRFSISHGIFLVGVLYRFAERASDIDGFFYDQIGLLMKSTLPTYWEQYARPPQRSHVGGRILLASPQ